MKALVLIRDGHIKFAIPCDDHNILQGPEEMANLQPPPWRWELRPGDMVSVMEF